jgi:2-polyprenyl-3-methyl-5-hydroxy-6-metoxy-1,4-benzoquinol methylase
VMPAAEGRRVFNTLPIHYAMNRKSYNAIASSWDAARHSFYGRERYYLDIFLEGLPVPSRILDLGCGTGRPMAEYILSRGHDLTGVDQASKLLEFAVRRFPQGNWIESRIQDFESTEHFAGVVCWDALFHIERSLHDVVLLRIAKILCAGGRLMLTLGAPIIRHLPIPCLAQHSFTTPTRPTRHFLFCNG